jgi:hypothetical protein
MTILCLFRIGTSALLGRTPSLPKGGVVAHKGSKCASEVNYDPLYNCPTHPRLLLHLQGSSIQYLLLFSKSKLLAIGIRAPCPPPPLLSGDRRGDLYLGIARKMGPKFHLSKKLRPSRWGFIPSAKLSHAEIFDAGMQVTYLDIELFSLIFGIHLGDMDESRHPILVCKNMKPPSFDNDSK